MTKRLLFRRKKDGGRGDQRRRESELERRRGRNFLLFEEERRKDRKDREIGRGINKEREIGEGERIKKGGLDLVEIGERGRDRSRGREGIWDWRTDSLELSIDIICAM